MVCGCECVASDSLTTTDRDDRVTLGLNAEDDGIHQKDCDPAIITVISGLINHINGEKEDEMRDEWEKKRTRIKKGASYAR